MSSDKLFVLLTILVFAISAWGIGMCIANRSSG